MAEGAETPGKGALSAQEEERRGRSTRGRYPARTLSVSVREKETVDLGARDESDRGPQQLSPSHQKGDTGDRRDRRDNGDEPAETAEALECRGSGAGEERDAGSPQVSDSEEGRASFSVEPPSHGSSERADEKEGDSAAHEDDETRKARRERKRERRRQETLAAEASIEQDGPKRYAFREKRQKRERFEADIFAKKSYTAVPTGYQLSAEIPPDQVQGLQLFVYRKKRRARAGSARPGGDAGANGETRGLEPRDRLESVSVTGTVSDAGDAEDEAVAAGVREGVSRAGSTEEASRDRRHQKPTRNGPGRPRIHPPSASLLGHRGMGEAARRAGLGMGALRSSQNQKEERRAPVQDLEGRREEESAVGLDANRGGLPKKRTEALKAASEKKKLPSDGSRGFKRTVVAGGKKRDGRRKQSDGEDEDEESEVAVISEDNARKIREQFFQDAAAVEEYLPFGLYYGDSLASDTALLERQEDTRKERYLEAKKAFQREMFQRLFLASVMREEGVKAERARRENEGAGVIATSEASSARAPARAAEITEEAEVNEEAEKGKASQEAEEDGRGVKVEGGECASSAESRPRETSERQGCREREKTLERSSSAAGDVGDSSPSLTRRRERRQSSVASPASSSAAQEGLADERVFSVSAACPRAVKTEEPAGGAALTDGEARDSSALRGKAASQEASDGAAAKDDEASRMEDEATVVEVPGGRSGETPDGTASREERDANKENKAAQHLWEYAPLPFPAQAPTAEGFFSEILARETVKEDTETRRQATKSLQASAASLLQAAARLAESRPFMNSLAASFSSSGPRWREEEKEDAKSEEQEKGKKARREEERTKERDRGEKEESGEQKMRACSREGLRVGPLLSPLEGREASRGPAPVGLFGAVQEDAKKLKPAFSAVTSSLSRLLRVLPPSVLHDSLPPRMRLSSGALAALAKEERAGRGEEPQTKREEAQDAHGGSESSKDAEATEGDTQREGEKSRWESRSPGHLSSTPAASTFAVGTAEKETRTREETNAEEPDVAPLHRGRPGSALSEKRLFFDSNTFAHVPLRQLRCWAAPPGLRPARPVSWRRVRALLRAAGARRLARLQAESQRQGVFYAPASGDWEALSVIHPVVSWEGNEGLEGLRHPGLLFAEEGEETDSCDCSDDEGVATAGSGCTKKNKDSGSLAAELQADAPRASPPAGASSGRGVSWRGLVLAEATGSAAGSAPEPGGSSSGSSGAAPAAGASHAKAAVPALPASLPAAVCQPFLAARATLQARQEEKRMGLPPPLPVRPHCLSADLAAVAKALWSPTGGCHVVGSADRHWQRVDRVLNAFHLSQVAQTKGTAKPGEIEEKGEDRRETKPETLPAFDASLLPANFKNLLEPVHFFPAEQDLEAQARLLEQARALARAHSPSQGAATAKGPKAAGSRGPGDPLGSPTGGGDSSGKASSKKRPGLDPFGPALSEEERKGEQRSAAGPGARDGAGDVEGARKDSQGGSQGGEKSGLTCSAASLKKLQTDAANNPEVEADIRQLLLWRWRKESASPVLFGPGATALEPQGPGDEETPRPETATEKPESEEERENGDARAEACAKTHGNVEGGKKRLLADAERKEDRDGLREEESGKRRRNEEERGKEGKRLSTLARASAGRPGADCGAHDGDETPTSLSAATTAAPGSTVGSASAEEGEKAFGRDKPAGTGQGDSGARPRRSAARTRLAEVLTAVKGGGPGSGESGPGGTPSGPGASSAPFSVSSASQPFGAPASPAEALGSSGSASPGALGATGEGAVAVAVAAPGTPPLKCLLRLLRHYPLSVLAQRLGVHRSTVARWAKMWTRQQIEEEGEEDGDELEGPVASSASSVRGLDA